MSNQQGALLFVPESPKGGSGQRVAADQGDYSAQIELCKMYAAGRAVPQDYEEAEKLFRQLLDRGYELATDLILVQEILRMQKELVAHRVV